ncbi:MAG: HAD family hydrolase [Pseudomonadota bacterium]
MWSGPRNISTAMMRSFENRPDTEVWDEPFYGCYLEKTGIPHPGASEIIEHHGSDDHEISIRCSNPGPEGQPVFYQKHMTMHLLPDMDRQWLGNVTNCFLIRKPELVASSYEKVRPDLTLFDLGFVQQAELFDFVIKITGEVPPVIDCQDFLFDPETMLRLICDRLQIPFRTDMIAWPAGKRDSDGIWGQYWYDKVWQSTGFEEYRDRRPVLSSDTAKIVEEALPYYDVLHQHRLGT